jgi:hypothetical protein
MRASRDIKSRLPALFARRARGQPLFDALVRNAFPALKQGKGADDAGGLPFGEIEIFLDGLRREEGAAAAGILCQFFQARLGRSIEADRKGVCSHMVTV